MTDNIERKEGLDNAKDIAKKILSGQIDPHEGANQIAYICHDLDYPDILLDFLHLAHLQEGHEHLGFYKENIRNEIIKEAEKFIGATP
jgi:hypothetical protein